MTIETKLNQLIIDTEISPSVILHKKGVPNNANWNSENGECYFEAINGETVSQSQYDTWKSEKTIDEWKVNPIDEIKASAKAKLIAGEPLTKEEADTIVL
jgi:hypothetical protein